MPVEAEGAIGSGPVGHGSGCVDRQRSPPAPEVGLGVHGEQVGPVVGVVVGDDDGVDLGRVDQGLEDGEGAGSGVEHQTVPPTRTR